MIYMELPKIEKPSSSVRTCKCGYDRSHLPAPPDKHAHRVSSPLSSQRRGLGCSLQTEVQTAASTQRSPEAGSSLQLPEPLVSLLFQAMRDSQFSLSTKELARVGYSSDMRQIPLSFLTQEILNPI